MRSVKLLDRFHIAARLHAPPGSAAAHAVVVTIASLASGSLAEDEPWLVPPVRWARARRVPGADLVVVYRAGDAQVWVIAVAPVALMIEGSV